MEEAEIDAFKMYIGSSIVRTRSSNVGNEGKGTVKDDA